jgi:hypothetical protein
MNNIKLVAQKGEFKVYFDSNKQEYTVFKDGKYVVGNKYKFSEVKCYIN